MSNFSLQGKRILVSAGPTWVPIDAVRHIGNFATGRLGLLLAHEATRRGAAATLLLGPTRLCLTAEERAAIRIEEYTYFDELQALVRREVGSGGFDAFLHSAAVSDYAPEPATGKLRSGQESLVLRLRPLPKIVDEVKALDPTICLVKFKLEVDVSRAELIAIAQASRAHSRADLIVANDKSALTAHAHPALILGAAGVIAEVGTKDELARALLEQVAQRLQRSGESR